MTDAKNDSELVEVVIDEPKAAPEVQEGATEAADPAGSAPSASSSPSNGPFSRDLGAARNAYKTGDAEASKVAHGVGGAGAVSMPVNIHRTSGKYVRSVVLGGLDGVITTAAAVSGVAGAGLSTPVILALGFSSLFADALSMGLGDFLSSKAEIEYARQERKREAWEFDINPEGEIFEMVQFYNAKGMPREDAETAVRLLAAHRDLFVDVMMVEELGIMAPDDDDSPAKNGLVTFMSFIMFGVVPLLSFTLLELISSSLDMTEEKRKSVSLIAAVILTAMTLFVLGIFKASFTGQNIFKSGTGILFNGGLATFLGFAVGWFFEAVIFSDRDICE